MDIPALSAQTVQEFIAHHKDKSAPTLALTKMPFEGELRQQILHQITAYQKAVRKYPAFASKEGLVFPPADLIEQASSERTAHYKASLFYNLTYRRKKFLDLTSGLGVDSFAVSSRFDSGHCIESDPVHAKCLRHNLKILGIKNITVLEGYAEEMIERFEKVDLVLIDPQRRNDNKNGSKRKGLFSFSECSPNIIAQLPRLRELSVRILIKASPFLDIHEGVRQLKDVSAVHVLEHDGQCKEVLYDIDYKKQTDNPLIITANCDTGASYTCTLSDLKRPPESYIAPLTYLYEPSPALMKSAAHVAYAKQRGLLKLAAHTHLYTSDKLLTDYMGRTFKVTDIFPLQKKEIYKVLDKKQANITVRNFPMSPDELRQKLSLKDGGDITIFACTLQDGEKRLIVTHKAV